VHPDVLTALAIAGPLASAGACYGLLRGDIKQNRCDIERLEKEKATSLEVRSLENLLNRIEGDLKAGLARIEATIQGLWRHRHDDET